MAPKKIIIKGNPVRGEDTANAGITPGHIIELISTGKVQKQATASLNSPKMVAIENWVKGDEIGTAYAANEQVQWAICGSGDEAYCFLSDGENVSIGDELEFGTTDGEFVARSSGISVATALEAVDLSASSNSAAGRIKLRFH